MGRQQGYRDNADKPVMFAQKRFIKHSKKGREHHKRWSHSVVSTRLARPAGKTEFAPHTELFYWLFSFFQFLKY